ncbi:MAG: efflux transporter outer membrane subunit [Niabella sp.]
MHTVSIIAAFLWLVFLFQSCAVSKQYTRDENGIVQPDMFRAEFQTKDTATLATIHWQDFFSDAQLRKYISEALNENLDLQMAMERIKTSEAYYNQAKAQFFPTVTVAPEVAYNTQSVNTQFGQIIGERRHLVQYSIPFALSWEADIWGKISSSKRAAHATLLSAASSVQAAQSLLVSNVAQLYYQLLVLDEQQSITEATIVTRKKSLETSKALKESGTLTEVAVRQSEALVLNAEGLLVTINNQIKILENTFSLLLGKNSGHINRSSLEMQTITTQLSYGVPMHLLVNRPDVRAAEFDLMNAFELTNVARANFYPSLKLTASTGLQSIDIDKLFSLNSLFVNAVASLTQPLWNKRQLRTQKEVALANRQIAYLNYRKSILTASKEVSDALLNYEAQNQLMTIKEKEYKTYQLATEYSQELVNYGMANYLEVLRSQENELNAQLSHLNAYYGKLSAVVQLYRALGGGAK